MIGMKHTSVKTIFVITASSLLFSLAAYASENEGWDEAWAEFEENSVSESSPWSWQTSLEGAIALRTQHDPAISDDATLAELRNNWSIFYEQNNLKGTLKFDLIADHIDTDQPYQIREANVFYRLSNHLDIKAGRQILTWGTGDLIFLNDMFPKDWQSFFSGRDTQYLKAPSDALKVSAYSDLANLDIVYSPKFDGDMYIDGERLSYYSPIAMNFVSADMSLPVVSPQNSFKDEELAIRLNSDVHGTELAIYYYDGFFKSPGALLQDQDSGDLISTFSGLRVYGASARGSTQAGIFNGEIAAYRSLDDPNGENPLIPNNQDRLLLGYETEAATNITISFQYYLERTRHYRKLIINSPFPALENKEYRQVWTNRITYQSADRNWTYALFSFYSTSDKDGYLRPSINYRYSDQLQITAGGNYLFGEDKHTFFNRFKYNSNIYIRAKYYF